MLGGVENTSASGDVTDSDGMLCPGFYVVVLCNQRGVFQPLNSAAVIGKKSNWSSRQSVRKQLENMKVRKGAWRRLSYIRAIYVFDQLPGNLFASVLQLCKQCHNPVYIVSN